VLDFLGNRLEGSVANANHDHILILEKKSTVVQGTSCGA
jgi:hypothetical protein